MGPKAELDITGYICLIKILNSFTSGFKDPVLLCRKTFINLGVCRHVVWFVTLQLCSSFWVKIQYFNISNIQFSVYNCIDWVYELCGASRLRGLSGGGTCCLFRLFPHFQSFILTACFQSVTSPLPRLPSPIIYTLLSHHNPQHTYFPLALHFKAGLLCAPLHFLHPVIKPFVIVASTLCFYRFFTFYDKLLPACLFVLVAVH